MIDRGAQARHSTKHLSTVFDDDHSQAFVLDLQHLDVFVRSTAINDRRNSSFSLCRTERSMVHSEERSSAIEGLQDGIFGNRSSTDCASRREQNFVDGFRIEPRASLISEPNHPQPDRSYSKEADQADYARDDRSLHLEQGRPCHRERSRWLRTRWPRMESDWAASSRSSTWRTRPYLPFGRTRNGKR